MKEDTKERSGENPVEEKEQSPEELVEKVKKETAAAGGRPNLSRMLSKVTVELSKPFTWCGETYENVELDFEGLTGRDMEAIDDMIGVMGLRGVVPAYSRVYQRHLCARASGMPSDAIEALPISDYNAMVGAAQRFLLITG